jgi:hypothetical protein
LLSLGPAVTVFGADRPPERIAADELQRLAPKERALNQYAKVVMLDGSSTSGRKFRVTGREVGVYSGHSWKGLAKDQVARIEIWPDRQNVKHIRRAGRFAARVVNAPCSAMEGWQPVSVCLPLKIASGGARLGTSLAAVAPVVLAHDVKALGAEPTVYEVVH